MKKAKHWAEELEKGYEEQLEKGFEDRRNAIDLNPDSLL